MATITTRSGKGSALTHTELDNNFTNLNTDKVEASGDTITGNLDFNDNVKAQFGAGNDLQIYHDGSNSRIKDNGTGGLYVQGSSFISLTNAAATETYVYAAENGAVQLKYDNATKLATTSTGIDVVGRITTSGGSADIQSNLFGAGDGSATNPSIRNVGDSDTGFWFPAANTIGFSTGGSERMRIDSSGNVGIGTSSPQGPLQVALSSARNLVVDFDTEGDNRTSLRSIESTANNLRPIQIEGQEIVLGTAAYDQTVSAERMRIDSSGNVLVGKTLAGLENRGFQAEADGQVRITSSGQSTLQVNRKSTDGPIQLFYRDESEVGRIGTHNIASSSRLYVGSGDVNLMFRPDIEVIQPASDSGLRDAAISLGNASGRFKDLYLSGGLHGDTTFKNNAGTTEYARFNSSGNLLVGKISTGTNNVGTQISGDGYTAIVATSTNIPFYLENKAATGNCRISFANNSHGGASLGLNNGGDFTIFDSTASTTRFNVTSSRVITASGGIAGIELGGVGVGNRLDDYEEGTFTPVVTGSTTAGTGTYSSQSGTYTKVGQVVTCSFAVNMTAHDGAGNIRISLPFSSNTNAVGMVMDQNLNYGSGASLVAFTQNQEFVQLYAVGDNLAWDVQTLADDTAFTLFVTITYRT